MRSRRGGGRLSLIPALSNRQGRQEIQEKKIKACQRQITIIGDLSLPVVISHYRYILFLTTQPSNNSLDRMSETILYGFAGLLFYQVYVTIRVVRSKSYTPAQKWRQFLFIWLVPFVGAAITLAVLATDKKIPVGPDKDFVPQEPKDRG